MIIKFISMWRLLVLLGVFVVGLSQDEDNATISLAFEEEFIALEEQVDYVSRALQIEDSTAYDDLVQQCAVIDSGMDLLEDNLRSQNLFISDLNHFCTGPTQFNRTAIRLYLPYIE